MRLPLFAIAVAGLTALAAPAGAQHPAPYHALAPGHHSAREAHRNYDHAVVDAHRAADHARRDFLWYGPPNPYWSPARGAVDAYRARHHSARDAHRNDGHAVRDHR
ncbi:MAG: hypothetical protein K2X87_21905 [Gemmataceae bacterium]|nr:hypothetical protein [Gemmataceae bacterium]